MQGYFKSKPLMINIIQFWFICKFKLINARIIKCGLNKQKNLFKIHHLNWYKSIIIEIIYVTYISLPENEKIFPSLILTVNEASHSVNEVKKTIILKTYTVIPILWSKQAIGNLVQKRKQSPPLSTSIFISSTCNCRRFSRLLAS